MCQCHLQDVADVAVVLEASFNHRVDALCRCTNTQALDVDADVIGRDLKVWQAGAVVPHGDAVVQADEQSSKHRGCVRCGLGAGVVVQHVDDRHLHRTDHKLDDGGDVAAAAAAQSPQQVCGARTRVDVHHLPVGHHRREADHVVRRKPRVSGQRAKAAAERVASPPDGGALAANNGARVVGRELDRANRVSDGRPALDAREPVAVLEGHRAHVAQVQGQRAGRHSLALVCVIAASRVHRHVVPRRADDRRRDLRHARGVRDGRRPRLAEVAQHAALLVVGAAAGAGQRGDVGEGEAVGQADPGQH
mmetsp:Transcript_2783/g.7505  ORF Transcript_2783/g.7505 Transcript_2783/m.7505 type:complete len:306 (-) Transcript_2783:152-1069(-)